MSAPGQDGAQFEASLRGADADFEALLRWDGDGGSGGGTVGGNVSGNGLPQLSALPGRVREWARVRVLHESDGDATGSTRHARPKVRMAPPSHARFCSETRLSRNHAVARLFMPRGGCADDPAPDPDPLSADWALGFPASTHYGSEDVYVNDPNEWISFVSAECAVSEQLISSPQVMFNLVAPGHMLAVLERHTPVIPVGTKVIEVEEAAVVGPLAYPTLYGSPHACGKACARSRL